MKAAIMQPYFFPYIGYFQLMAAVDTFVIYDDVQYMKGGWVNRNRVRIKNRATWITFPVHQESIVLPINQRSYLSDSAVVQDIKNKLCAYYSSADAYSETSQLVFSLLDHPDRNVARFNTHLLTELSQSMGIECNFIYSSNISKSNQLRGAEKVIDICKRIGARHYINAIGGLGLYQPEDFETENISLSFLRTKVEPAILNDGPNHLSIIDTLMYSGVVGGRKLLNQYELVKPGNSSDDIGQ